MAEWYLNSFQSVVSLRCKQLSLLETLGTLLSAQQVSLPQPKQYYLKQQGQQPLCASASELNKEGLAVPN